MRLSSISARCPRACYPSTTPSLVPGAHLTVTAVAPYGDVLTVRIGDVSHAVGGTIARRVQVRPDVDGTPEREPAAGEAGAGGEPASIYHRRDGEEAPLAPRREESDQWAHAARTTGGPPADCLTP